MLGRGFRLRSTRLLVPPSPLPGKANRHNEPGHEQEIAIWAEIVKPCFGYIIGCFGQSQDSDDCQSLGHLPPFPGSHEWCTALVRPYGRKGRQTSGTIRTWSVPGVTKLVDDAGQGRCKPSLSLFNPI